MSSQQNKSKACKAMCHIDGHVNRAGTATLCKITMIVLMVADTDNQYVLDIVACIGVIELTDTMPKEHCA